MEQEYFLGLDIGTESVGWAVTDLNYRIVKRNGKALWGVRLFKEAQTAAERRQARVARRMVERTRSRLDWLQNVFADEIGKVDPAFFQRLRESKFSEEDKLSDHPLGRYTLFNDPAFNDRVYRRKYPTIYHLRYDLLNDKSAHDVRLVYLALHHIMKNRGHFLFGNVDLESVTFEAGWDELAEYLSDNSAVLENAAQAIKEIMTDRNANSGQKKKRMMTALGINAKDKQLAAICDLLSGRKANLQNVIGAAEPIEGAGSFSLKSDIAELEENIGTGAGDSFELVCILKRVYDWAVLDRIQSGTTCLSEAKIRSYEKHRQDLALLKKTVKAMGTKTYSEVFRKSEEKLCNYVAYSGHRADAFRCSQEDFYGYLKKLLKGQKSSEAEKILAQIDEETFLPRQTTKENSVIPHQLHQKELAAIISNASVYLPFLTEKDETGLTVGEKIIQMFAFRIPYYVGPLDTRSKHSWVKRRMEPVYPWNFEQVVDVEESAKQFISRMTAKCSYLGEDVLPKNSLLYTKFMVLNELNNLRINSERLPVELKQNIFNDVFLQGRKITRKVLMNYLQSVGAADRKDEISGIDGDFKTTLAPYRQFAWLLQKPDGERIAEDIIRHITLFGEDQKLLAKWLRKNYGDTLSAQELKTAAQNRYTGWGNLSAEFLTQVYHVVPETGECMSIMDGLWQTQCNLMELLSSRYGYAEAVEQYRTRKLTGAASLDEYLADSYASPAIKRAIHQTVSIIDELEKIMGQPPKRVFLEVAREEGQKGQRTISRKAQLEALYAKCGAEAAELYQQLKLEDDGKLRSDKYYLYYTQLGRCMYSGEAIDLSSLDRYDIDHIYPQSKTKDDSLDNRVLVKRQLNGEKGDSYPLPSQWREKMRPYWQMLKVKGLISAKKYDRLTGHEPLSDEQLAGFIARQLVETRQSTKIIAELLNNRYQGASEVVYVKAGNVSSFRQDQRLTEDGIQLQASECGGRKTVQDPLFVKCREVNDFHHAKDAYLNIVVGNVYFVKFTRSPANFIKNHTEKYSLNRMFDFDVKRGEDQAWVRGAAGSIAVVRKAMAKNNILFTRMPVEQKGELFDLQIVKAGKGQTPIKSSDPRMTIEKFGGYNKLTGAYFCLVEHTKQKKRVRSLETVYLMQKAAYEKDPECYCRTVLGLEEPVVLVKKILIDSLISVDGFRMHISGRTGDALSCKNAMQLVIAPRWSAYIKGISKYLQRCTAARTELKVTEFDGITDEMNRELYALLLEKLETSVYGRQYGAAIKNLKVKQNVFAAASVPVQCRVLMQVLNLFACNVNSADLKELGGPKTGFLQPSKNLGNISISLVHQSVTGFFEQTVPLNAPAKK